jgi:hypothetical protein
MALNAGEKDSVKSEEKLEAQIKAVDMVRPLCMTTYSRTWMLIVLRARTCSRKLLTLV